MVSKALYNDIIRFKKKLNFLKYSHIFKNLIK